MAHRVWGRIAGVGYVLIFALAMHANFAVVESLPNGAGAGAVADFVRRNEALFRIAAAEFLAVMAVDVVVAYALWRLLSDAPPGVNTLSALFRLTYTVANIPVILTLFTALRWAGGEGALADAMTAEAALRFGPLFTLTLAFFGMHLILLGAAAIASARLPAVVGVLTAVAGAAYALDATALLLAPEARAGLGGTAEMLVIVPAVLGEASLMLWLLFGPLRGRAE